MKYLPSPSASLINVFLASGVTGSGRFCNASARIKNMELLGISNLSRRCYRELSGGQQQRVLLARALCATSKLLLLDEPVSGLDPLVTAELYGVIEELNRLGLTVVMISHDISAAVNYATHILHLGSTPLFFGTKEDYLESEVGQMLQAPTVCTCIPLIKPLITPTKNSENFISIAPVTPHLAQNGSNFTSSLGRARPGTRVQKNTVPRIAKSSIGQPSKQTESEDIGNA